MLPAGTRCPTSACASSNCRSARSVPCINQSSQAIEHPTYTRVFMTLVSVLCHAHRSANATLPIAAVAPISTDMVKGYAAAFESAGCDELIFIRATASPDQLELLADAAL